MCSRDINLLLWCTIEYRHRSFTMDGPTYYDLPHDVLGLIGAMYVGLINAEAMVLLDAFVNALSALLMIDQSWWSHSHSRTARIMHELTIVSLCWISAHSHDPYSMVLAIDEWWWPFGRRTPFATSITDAIEAGGSSAVMIQECYSALRALRDFEALHGRYLAAVL